MNESRKKISLLAEVEMETLEEGREWMRKRLARKIQRLVNKQGMVSPPESPEAQGGKISSGSDHHDRRQG